ncbi:Putative protection of telomeres protein [Colletotrichum destructivum]|uniref:Protection of telomeres protein 1 n=1 Tax=Colletotrichum destructivum TaxID=34406 RepID=A0AAX4I9W6_9PEZI|nr:Putative protection of telomeres protein [Colletotrichum destructivum]
MAGSGVGTAMDLPQGYAKIVDILDEKVTAGGFLNVIGIVVDFQKPIPTKGGDYKARIRLFDMSVSGENRDIALDIFRPSSQMFEVGAGDIIVIHQAKCQRYRSDPLSLITNYTTAIHVYPAAKTPPSPAQPASNPLMPSKQDSSRKPSLKDEQYISWFFHNVDKTYIPDIEQFNIQATRSLNVKDKLCELKDVKDGTFHDVIAQVIQEPYDYNDKIRLYVSDYTENSGFFNYRRDGQVDNNSRDGDPYGYTSGKAGTPKWIGPFGKRTLQITCWEPHATVIRQRVKNGSWVHLLNIQFKFGTNGRNLEGYLRQDQNAFPNKVYVDVLDLSQDSEQIHPSLKNAIRRKRDYEKEEKAQRTELQSAQKTSKKRPAADQPEDKRLNAKQRRAIQRAQAAEKATRGETSAKTSSDLNQQVVAEYPEQPAVPVSVILEPAKYATAHQGGPLLLDLPFTCAKYRTNVRVIDFYPRRLQDFARVRKQTECDILSDYSGTDSEPEEEAVTIDSFVDAGDRIWQWRFALRLQDVTAAAKDSSGQKENSFWVVVDNMDAQLLTSLDACDFRVNPDELTRLREKMFILWGDLEEKKAKELENTSKKQKAKMAKKTARDRPPDSSDNEEPKKEKEVILNRPFTCCIRQYGVRINESNPDKANAGEGKRWKRMFGLFGTKICDT